MITWYRRFRETVLIAAIYDLKQVIKE